MLTFNLGSSVACPNGDAAVTQEAADRHSVGGHTLSFEFHFTLKRGKFNYQ